MASLIRAKLELVTESEVLQIMKKDAPALTSNIEGFLNDNLFGFYVLLNTWLMIIRQYSTHGWARALDAMSRDGCIAIINRASIAATQLIKNEVITDSLMDGIIRDVNTILAKNAFTPESQEKEIGKDFTATALFVLRYPKRFSPQGNDLVQKASIKDFLDTENRSKLIQRRGVSRYWLERVRDEMGTVINWSLFSQIARERLRPYYLELTSGANLDSRASLGSKLVALGKTEPSYFPAPFGYPWSGAYERGPEEKFWGYYTHYSKRLVDVRAVPKSYKASRIIAMETVVNQGYAKAVSKILDDFMPEANPIHDQAVNQVLAEYGSITGGLATEDLSHASDTITKSFMEDILPDEALWILDLLGTHTVIDGKERIMQQASTAGNSLTFQLESLTFLAISRAVIHTYEWYSQEKLASRVTVGENQYAVPSVYGDDIVIHSQCHDTFLDAMSALGFIVNEDKSYAHGEYRESCGAEYWAGVDVSGYYFPRFPLLGTLAKQVDIKATYRRDSFTGDLADTLTSLVSLQHRLYFACYDASYFILALVREAHPKMTTSSPGSKLEDCWDYEDTCAKRWAPYARVVHDHHGHTIRDEHGVAKLERVQEPRAARTAKFLPTVKWKVSKPISDYETRLFELYKYQQFLRHGPKYEDELMRLLGISSRPVTTDEAFGSPTVVWNLREIDYE
jgi:hypothetical protein